MRANRCQWDAGTSYAAAEGGHLEVLQWARANGCDWNADTCSAAAKGGHLEVLQWLRANGCDWNVWAWKQLVEVRRCCIGYVPMAVQKLIEQQQQKVVGFTSVIEVVPRRHWLGQQA